MPSNRLVSRSTYADYLTWDEEQRYEILDFVPYMLAAPSVEHQRVVGRLFRKVADRLDGTGCEPFVAPFDLRLAAPAAAYDKIGNVVQPDITVICDKTGLDENGYSGAPTLVVEVISPSSAKMDRWLKYNAYQNRGIREYWLVIPAEQLIEVHVLNDGKYEKSGVYGLDEQAVSRAVPELEIAVNAIFDG